MHVLITVKTKPPFWMMLYLFREWNQNEGGTYFGFKISCLCWASSMESSRRDILNGAEHMSILKTYRGTYHPRLGFTPRTGKSIPQYGGLFLLWWALWKVNRKPEDEILGFGRTDGAGDDHTEDRALKVLLRDANVVSVVMRRQLGAHLGGSGGSA